MTQEDKELLLKDLCARLPYHIKCQMEDDFIINDSPLYDYILSEKHIELFRNHKGFYIKPYLRPMSSMTEEEKKEYNHMYDVYVGYEGMYSTINMFDWLNKNHFDYRGLIEKGLAISVTKENNPYKE